MRRRQAAGFVARTDELARFRANLALPVDDPGRRFIFAIHGDGGVGKTLLSRRLRELADGYGSATAWADERVFGAPEAMQAIAADLSRAGVDTGGFDKLLANYLRRRQEAADDPNAPAGTATFITKTVVRVGLSAVKAAPGAGGLADAIDKDTAAAQADLLRQYLARKFRRHEDVRLLLSPVEVLSPAFTEALVQAGRRRPLALFFDTYEQTGTFLDGWLRQVLDGNYGQLPADLVVTIAGRHALDMSAWSGYTGVMASVPLLPFTEAEARQFLSGRGVTGERVVQVILKVSGRLPLLLAMLAENQPADPEKVGDPSGSAVERFLTWETDQTRRSLAVTAALPRVVSEDVLGVLADAGGLDAGERGRLFGWLRSLPFVTADAGRCSYHEVVRTAMISVERSQSPARWRERHQALAAAYQTWASQVSADDAWADPRWRDLRLEAAYHLLCSDPSRELTGVLTGLAYVLDQGRAVAVQWAQMIAQAGGDTGAAVMADWGQRLDESLSGTDAQATFSCADLLLRQSAIAGSAVPFALRLRGRALYLLDRDEEALADLDRAIKLAPGDKYALTYRGEARTWVGRHEEALADFDQAIALDPGYSRTLAGRGDTYRLMGRYDEALADLTRAIELNPEDVWVLTSQGETYRLMGRHDEAVSDLTRAIELNPDVWALTSRGDTYRLMGRHDEAVSDLTRAIQLNPEYAWAIARRGETYRLTGRHDEAVSDLTRAIELNPAVWALTGRGDTYRLMGRHDEAVSDLTRAIDELNPDVWALTSRGETYRLTGRYDEALADLARAIELNPDVWALNSRGETYRLMGRYDEAHADFTRAIELNPDAWTLTRRGDTYRLVGRYDEALADLARAIELSPDYDWGHYQRALALHCHGDTGRAADELRSAVALVTEALKSADCSYRCAYNVGVYFAGLRDYVGARNRFTSAITEFPNAQGSREAIDNLRELCAVPGMDAAAIELLIGLLGDGSGNRVS
jgi:tetratricopeptide (TPR) repeat protein